MQDYYSDLQKDVLSKRINGCSYSEIISAVPAIQFSSNVKACLKRSALGYVYDLPHTPPCQYLCPIDVDSLILLVQLHAEQLDPLMITNVIDEAFELKKGRWKAAFMQLMDLGCPVIANEVFEAVPGPPSRSWVMLFAQEHQLEVRTNRGISIDRVIGCWKPTIENYLDTNKDLLESFDPRLIFGADETMIDSQFSMKVVVPAGERHSLRTNDEFPHLTAMLAHSACGAVVPPFIIVPKLCTVTIDIREAVKSNRMWIASNAKGWMTGHAFCLWVIHFCHWLSMYRLNLPDDLKNKGVLLIADGATSHSAVWGLQLLRKYNITLLILPPHTSHILQMFDVCLSSPLKRAYYCKLSGVSKSIPTSITTHLGRLRYAAIIALTAAWYSVADVTNCRASAKYTSVYPFDKNQVLSSEFIPSDSTVEKLRTLNARRRRETTIDISGKIITTDDMISALHREASKRRNSESIDFDPNANYESELLKLIRVPNATCLLTFTPQRAVEIRTTNGEILSICQMIGR